MHKSGLVFADGNCRQAQHLGAGLAVTVGDPIHSNILGVQLGEALRKVLADGSFRAGARKVSRLMRSPRHSPAEKAASTHDLHCYFSCCASAHKTLALSCQPAATALLDRLPLPMPCSHCTQSVMLQSCGGACPCLETAKQ